MLNCKNCIVECYDSCEINVREKALRSKPKEDTMPEIRKPIEFEDREHAKNFFTDLYKTIKELKNYEQSEWSESAFELYIKEMLMACEKLGLIRRDPVEEAEEMREEYIKAGKQNLLNVKQHEAIQRMKPYYEKYKGEKIHPFAGLYGEKVKIKGEEYKIKDMEATEDFAYRELKIVFKKYKGESL